MEGSGVSAPTEGPARSSSWTPANPAPLGLAGFAMTTFVLSMTNANWVSGADLPVVLGLALAYGGVAQLLAGMWEFRAGNTFGALAFSSFGAFWISYWLLVTFNVGELPAAHVGHALGLYLWAWAIFTAYMTIAALRVSGAVLLVFVLLTITFVLLGDRGRRWPRQRHPLGWLHWRRDRDRRVVRVVCGVVNSTFGKTVAPTLPAQQVGTRVAVPGCRGSPPRHPDGFDQQVRLGRWRLITPGWTQTSWSSSASSPRCSMSSASIRPPRFASARCSPTRRSTPRPTPTGRAGGRVRRGSSTGSASGTPSSTIPTRRSTSGSSGASSTCRTTAWTATSRPAAAIASPTTGAARRARSATSPTPGCSPTWSASPTR